jgi:hypothetical protein
VIVVIGQPVLHIAPEGPRAAGIAATAAAEAARRGAPVQLVGKVGEDRDGEAVVLALARDGVGHVALLRDPGRPTPRLVDSSASEPQELALEDEVADPPQRLEPADPAARPALDAGDLDLGLRYLTEFRVIVATEPLTDEAARIVTDATGWSGATLIAMAGEDGSVPADLPAGAIVLAAPPSDPDGAFARLVGTLAAAIDGGAEPHAAFREIVQAAGWEPAGA